MLTVDFACSNCQFIETLLGGFLIVLEESFFIHYYDVILFIKYYHCFLYSNWYSTVTTTLTFYIENARWAERTRDMIKP